MTNTSKLLLISPAAAAVVTTEAPVDRQGAEEHGKIGEAVSAIVGRAVKIEQIDPEQFANRVSAAIGNAAKMVQAKIADTLGQFTVDEVAISLAVSAEGDIGIASAGMEASIEVTLKRIPPPGTEKK